MFQVGDTIVYGSFGVCRVEDKREEKFGPACQEYYVLCPLKDTRSTYYCPVSQAEAKMRRLLTADEVETLIRRMPQAETVWIEEDNRRREQFSAILKSGNHADVIRLIKTLYLQREEKVAQGKRLHLSDERMLQEAQRLLHEEFAYVLAITPTEVVAYIEEILGKATV